MNFNRIGLLTFFQLTGAGSTSNITPPASDVEDAPVFSLGPTLLFTPLSEQVGSNAPFSTHLDCYCESGSVPRIGKHIVFSLAIQ